MIRTHNQRKHMRTDSYRLTLRSLMVWREAPGLWVALHRGSGVRECGSTKAKARTNCALRVYDIGWEE